jgi:hypothetical protein
MLYLLGELTIYNTFYTVNFLEILADFDLEVGSLVFLFRGRTPYV